MNEMSPFFLLLTSIPFQFPAGTFFSLNSLTHGAEPFLRSRQLCSHSRTSHNFMDPEGSLPCSQGPSTGPIVSQINPIYTILSKIHFNIVHSPTFWSSQWSLSLWLSHQYPICIPLIPIRATCHTDLILHFLLSVK
jgi:hypothetical protein